MPDQTQRSCCAKAVDVSEYHQPASVGPNAEKSLAKAQSKRLGEEVEVGFCFCQSSFRVRYLDPKQQQHGQVHCAAARFLSSLET
eukprot:s1480_g14.t1